MGASHLIKGGLKILAKGGEDEIFYKNDRNSGFRKKRETASFFYWLEHKADIALF